MQVRTPSATNRFIKMFSYLIGNTQQTRRQRWSGINPSGKFAIEQIIYEDGT